MFSTCNNRDLKKAATTMGMLLNKRFNEQNTDCACVYSYCWHLILHCLENMNHDHLACKIIS